MTRNEYVRHSKEHALSLLKAGRAHEAVAWMMTNMRVSPSFRIPREIHAIGICAAAANDAAGVRAYIEGFV
ncbi:hypothetical protein IQ17_01627 [Bradyrhizobium daqingense]|uniref:Uncharacterized protein n=1 Tax=Bradyrhizobium daqingense TaxID=993502 RepID=A0A562LMF3_9BRAD|nr:hypothetical protein IQ17_01627 [Bradyrhizobium daqingense]